MSDQSDGLTRLNQELLALNQEAIAKRLTEIEARLVVLEKDSITSMFAALEKEATVNTTSPAPSGTFPAPSEKSITPEG